MKVPLQIFHSVGFLTFEFCFQITEWKEVTETEIRPMGRLTGITKLAALKAVFSLGRSMKGGIVEMHYGV
jgi:hypothetical protein